MGAKIVNWGHVEQMFPIAKLKGRSKVEFINCCAKGGSFSVGSGEDGVKGGRLGVKMRVVSNIS